MMAEQLRAARAMLRMEQADVAEMSGVSVATIRRLEAMNGTLLGVRGETLEAIERAFQSCGIRFVNELFGSGVLYSPKETLPDAVWNDVEGLFPDGYDWYRPSEVDPAVATFSGTNGKGRKLIVYTANMDKSFSSKYLHIAEVARKLDDADIAMVVPGIPTRIVTIDGVELIPFNGDYIENPTYG